MCVDLQETGNDDKEKGNHINITTVRAAMKEFNANVTKTNKAGQRPKVNLDDRHSKEDGKESMKM